MVFEGQCSISLPAVIKEALIDWKHYNNSSSFADLMVDMMLEIQKHDPNVPMFPTKYFKGQSN